MTELEKIAAKHIATIVHDSRDGCVAVASDVAKVQVVQALRDLLDRCVAEVDAEMCVYDVALAVTKRKADALEKVKSRLARLGESGERD